MIVVSLRQRAQEFRNGMHQGCLRRFDVPGARRHGRYWSRPQSGGGRGSPAKRPCRDHPRTRDRPVENRSQFQDPAASTAIARADSRTSSSAHFFILGCRQYMKLRAAIFAGRVNAFDHETMEVIIGIQGVSVALYACAVTLCSRQSGGSGSIGVMRSLISFGSLPGRNAANGFGCIFLILITVLEFWSQFQDFGHNLKIGITILEFWSQFQDCGRNLKIGITILKFWSQFQDFGHNLKIGTTILRFWSQFQDFGHNLKIGTTILKFWSPFQDFGHNLKIGITILEFWPQFQEFSHDLKIGITILEFWSQSADWDENSGIVVKIARL